MDTEINTKVVRVLIVNNLTSATAGKYMCFAQFGNVVAKREVYINIKSKLSEHDCVLFI